ncbi:MAG: hypothetical protein VX589_12665, partial [Myxococcota bacterium]|nr:hypothetical protein [Myxococcota bacterium]
MLKQFLCVGAAFAMLACMPESDSNSSDNSGGSSETGAPAGEEKTATFTVTNAQTGMAIADAEFCVDGADACLKTSKEGTVDVKYTAGGTIIASVKAGGFLNGRVTVEPDNSNLESIPIPLAAEGVFAILAEEKADVKVSDERGHVAFIATVEGGGLSGQPGIEITVENEDGDSGDGKGPLYFRQGDVAELLAGDAYNLEATATTGSGVVNFFNLKPGTYTATLKGAEGCNTVHGKKDAETKIKFDVKAGEVSYLGTICPAIAYFIAQDGITSTAVGDAEFCIDGQDACLEPDENGVFALSYEFGTAVRGSVKSSGYTTARASGYLRNNVKANPGAIPLLQETLVETIATAGGVESVDPEKGHVVFLATINGQDAPNGQPGITFEFEPAIGGTGTLFVKAGNLLELVDDEEGIYDDMAMATTTSGAINVFNADPRDYKVTLTG